MPVQWLSKEKCITLLEKEVYGRLGTCDDNGQPYITPINLVVHNNKIYCHTGFGGRKLENIRSNPRVCLEVSASGKMYATPEARNFTMRFWSIIVFGKAYELKDSKLKLDVMNLLMQKYAKGYDYKPLSINDMEIVNVLEISIDEITGKVSVDPVEACE